MKNANIWFQSWEWIEILISSSCGKKECSIIEYKFEIYKNDIQK